MGEEAKKETSIKMVAKKIFIAFLFILFIYNAFRFIATPGSELPVLTILFNMVIYLGIIIFLLHKKEISCDGKYMQKKIDNYFKDS